MAIVVVLTEEEQDLAAKVAVVILMVMVKVEANGLPAPNSLHRGVVQMTDGSLGHHLAKTEVDQETLLVTDGLDQVASGKMDHHIMISGDPVMEVLHMGQVVRESETENEIESETVTGKEIGTAGEGEIEIGTGTETENRIAVELGSDVENPNGTTQMKSRALLLELPPKGEMLVSSQKLKKNQ